MKILQINTVYGYGSTGKIAKAIHDICLEKGIDCLSGYRCLEKGESPFEDTVAISSWLDSRIHGRWAQYTLQKGKLSRRRTSRFLDRCRPDLIHLHNLHGSYINLPLLFGYIKKHHIPVVWTLHDCWAFTGGCSHFVLADCRKWKDGCKGCVQYKQFSSAPLDLAGRAWRNKQKWFSGVENMTVVTPSEWMAGLARQSILKEYPVEVIPNGIDLTLFKPTYSEVREKYHIPKDKYIVLGVAFGWGYAKGLDVFITLADRLGDAYQIVLVGTDSRTDRQLPEKILSIGRTEDQKTLAELYTAADIFVNPTREEAFGLVNIEALACGTSGVTFRTGGSPECFDEYCGSVVECNDIDAMEAEIRRICLQKPYSEADCRLRAEQFSQKERLAEYTTLYERLIGSSKENP